MFTTALRCETPTFFVNLFGNFLPSCGGGVPKIVCMYSTQVAFDSVLVIAIVFLNPYS